MILDEQQLSAVKTSSRKALIVAAPGSGKTRCIIERAAYLVEECGVSAYELCLVTFTRHAANEMRSRLVERIGNKAYRANIGTFHATALQLLKRFGEVAGLIDPSKLTVYGEFEENFLLKDVAKGMNVYNGKSWKPAKKEVDAMFSAYYQNGVEPDQESPLRPLFDVFIARCRESNSLTYGSLLIGMKILLPHIKQHLQWKHIICDECQDMDQLQFDIVNMMVDLLGANLYMVADPDQSIYQWRGAVPEYLVQHQDDFDLYRIETNYRSLPDIVTMANNLIQRNTDRIPKVMRPSKTNEMDMPGYCEGEAVSVWRDIKSEDLVEWFIGNEIENPETAILSRVHGLLQKIDTLMTEREIPHTYIGKTTALTNSEPFRRFHAFLKLLVNPHDNFSFLLIKDLIGISKENYTAVRQGAAQEGQSHFQRWSFVNKTYDFFDVAEGYNFPDVIGRLLGSIAWPFEATKIAEFIADYIKTGPNPQWNEDCCVEGPIQHYLDWLATFDISDEVKSDNEGIILCTVHGAKGLEWDTVILAGCNEGILPSRQAINSGEIEQERRLFYVAMTRARNQLVLAVRPESEEKDGRIYESPISRFIGEAI